MKKVLQTLLLLCLLLFCLLAVSCGAMRQNASSDEETVPPPPEVSLSDRQITVGKGIIRRLDAAGGEHMTWTSSDESVATVDQDGNVVGQALGSCTVTVRNECGSSADCAVEVKKTCFITVDDAPNEWTYDILDVLTEYDAHATFFVVGAIILEDAVAQIQAQGSVVGLHTYSHNYEICYGGTTSYYYGLEVIGRRIEGVLGYRPNLIRFPGGTSNTSSDPLLMQRVANGAKDMGYRVFDWTATTGDTSELHASAAFSIENVKKYCTDDVEILLMHSKSFNAKALRTIIPYLRENGYVLETLDHYTVDSYMVTPRYARTHRLIPATGVKVNTPEATVKMGNTLRLSSQIVPYNSTDYVRWESSDPSVAEVWPNGKVIPLAEGAVTVSAIASSGERADCTVTVIP